MGTTGIILSHQQAGFARRVLLPFIVTLSLIASQLVLVGVAPAFAEGVDPEQCANGGRNGPRVACEGGAWINGALNASKSQYNEDDAVAFRMTMTGLEPTAEYRLTIGYDTTKGGAAAYDYLVGWNHSETGAPATGAPTSTAPIPNDPRVDNSALFDGSQAAPGSNGGARVFSLWGGDIGDIGAYRHFDGSYSSPVDATQEFGSAEGKVELPIEFTAQANTAVMAWGGHISDRRVWDIPTAADITGSPYHMRLRTLEKRVGDEWQVVSRGNKDMQLQANAVEAVIDLDITKAGPEGTVAPGAEFDYTISVTNSGNTAATGVTVTDVLPPGLIYDTATSDLDDCSEDEGTVTCGPGSVAAGATAVTTITVSTAAFDSCGSYDNTATFTADGDRSGTSNEVTTVVGPCDPNLAIEKLVDGDTDVTVGPGDTFAYTLTVTNDDATETARNVVVTDVLDLLDGSLSIEGSLPDGCAIDADDELTCSLGDLAPDADPVVITLTIRVADVDSCGAVSNVASAVADNDSATSGQVEVTIEDCDPVLLTDKTVDVDELSVLDDEATATYTLSVTNDPETATATATGVTISDTVPTGLSIVSVDPAEDCEIDGQEVDCGPFTIPVGDTVEVTIEVALDLATLPFTDGDQCGTLTNDGVFAFAGGSLPDRSADIEVIDCDAAVTFAKTLEGLEEGEDGTPIIDVTSTDTFTYVLRAENGDGATADATDVLIADEIPDVFEIVSVTPAEVEALDADGAPGCTIDGNGVKCGYWDLGPDESAEVRIEVRLAGGTTEDGTAIRDASQCGLVENAASVLAASTTGPIDLTDEVEVEVVGCDADIDLIKTAVATLDADGLIVDEVVQLDAPDGPKQLLLVAGDTDVVQITYTFEVTNTGNVTLYEVDLTDPLLGGDVTLSSDELLPGESATATATYDVDRVLDAAVGEVVNVATATGTTDTDETVEATDDEIVEIVEVDPSISIVKTADVEVGDDGLQVIEIAAGDTGPFTITYDYVVTNDGTETLVDLTLVDDKLPEVDLSAELAEAVAAMYPIATAEFGTPALPPGASVTVSADYTLTEADIAAGSVTNVAITTGAGGLSDRPVDDDDSVTVDIVEVLAIVSGLDLVKEALVEVGDDGLKVVEADEDGNATVTYRFTITNLGNSTIDDLSLLDDKIGEITLPATSLGAGESLVVEADYAVTADDLADGFVTNVGIVTGVDELGNTLTADDDERVELVQVLAEVVVEQLPRTGADSWLLLALASLMSALGAAVLLLTPNRRRAA